MKIVHLIPGLYLGGTEKVLEVIAQSQAGRGHTVSVITFEETPYHGFFSALSIFTCAVDFQMSLVKEDKMNIHQYENLITELNPDVIHSHSYWTDLISHYHIRNQIQYISHFHLCYPEYDNFRFSIRKKELSRLVDKQRLLQKFNRGNCSFMAASNSLYAYYSARLPKSLIRKFQVIPNPIDDRFFSLSPREEKNYDLVSVGRLEEIKNHQFLIHVVKHLYEQGILLRLAIVGDGSLRSFLQDLVNELNVAHLVCFLGVLKGEDLFSVFSASRIYVHASKEETFGLTLFESAAAGLPVITLEFKDILLNKPTDLIFDIVKQHDIPQFAKSITEVLSWSLSERNERTRKNRQAVRCLSASVYMEKMALAYKKIIPKPA